MKLLRQFGIILLLSFLGEVLHRLIPLPGPASIYGMVLMLLCLQLGFLQVEKVQDAGKYLIEIMPIMFIPAAVGLMDAWPVILILCRELAVDGLRMIAVGKGKVIAADKLGKWKTTFQMILICVLIFLNTPVYSTWYTISLLVIVVGLTLFSGFNYFRKNLTVFQEEKA